MSNRDIGLIDKYYVERRDGRPVQGRCIVLEFGDPNAWPALLTWADSVEADGYQQLADDVRNVVADTKAFYNYLENR